ncbi:MAG: hypothetical protein IJU11_05140 [Prevotella sp.]|nr:hypothetical protein [Prevotella sp.]
MVKDLKTVTGKSSVRNRLLESIGQANQVILNMATNYNARLLAKDLMYYFHVNPSAIEVIIFKGSQLLLIKRMAIQNKNFVKTFIQKYNRQTKTIILLDNGFCKTGRWR